MDSREASKTFFKAQLLEKRKIAAQNANYCGQNAKMNLYWSWNKKKLYFCKRNKVTGNLIKL